MKIIKKAKPIFLKIFRVNSPKEELNKFAEIRRNILIKKMRSNSIAIVTNQIDIYTGCTKMAYFISAIERIYYLENIDLEVFEVFISAFNKYPIWDERNYYNKEYLAKLDVELNSIHDQYKQSILEKCNEIIEKFEYIKNVC
ncbi:hypothetical protein [Flavobacterium pallidum]|uniref:DUF2489 domain-containing protein n=1 Tax=Flavobacterium pallidum TaxID=2172098 RepID=A0A2S1SKF7_9FLAO|nr:hypothetical protein [Flavobacterium pallidum]AWI26828.1 hypothetical protein HYN49_13485 [Flavobacterium pallidum]AWI26869.1 hypothetical protein HYN49_13690 [Flavobacterium pallidum]